MTPEIERLAKEAGWDVDGDGITMPYLSGYHDTADETAFLTKFAALVAEACAKECEAQADSHQDFKNTQAAVGCDGCADAIRAKFALSDLKDAAK